MDSRRRGRRTQQSRSGAASTKSLEQSQPELDAGSFKDIRLKWLYSLIGDYFRSHVLDQFRKNEENIKCMKEFLDAASMKKLYILEKDSNSLMLSATAPVDKRDKRMLFFTKVVDGPVSDEGFTRQVLVGDCNVDPVQHLEQLTQMVFVPLLSNSLNQASWSEAVRKEMMENIHGFVSNVQITSGLMRGETFLPLPNAALLPIEEDKTNKPTDDDHRESEGQERAKQNAKLLAQFGASKKSLSATASAPGVLGSMSEEQIMLQKERIHVFEGCLITWTKQIKNVLRMDPEGKLRQGLNPGPLDEVEFWRAKAANLNSIFEQLQSPQMRKVLRFLDSSKSTYNQPFAKLCKESFDARDEANSNVAFMKPLVPWFERLERGSDIDELCKVFKPIMHLLLLIWKTSGYYNSVPRLVVLIQEIANAVVARCARYMTGPQLFALIEADENAKAYDTLKSILRVIGSFKSTYFDYKARANAECVSNPWRVQNNALFSRLDSFLERCHDLLDLTQTISHFSKLNRIEIGGTKGKTLTNSVHQVHQDFENSFQSIKDVTYDVMDVDAKMFEDDFYEFRVKAKELERRVASVLTQGFDDCPTITGRFKLLDSFEEILERPIVQDELENKHLALLAAYNEDLQLVQEDFSEHRDNPPLGCNLPPTAGALTWCRGLLERVTTPMAKLRNMNSGILDREGARDVIKTYTSLVAGLAEFENDMTSKWEESIESSSISKLKLPLLRRVAEEKQLSVNFDPALVHLLREVKYFLLLGLKVPANALSIYEKVEEFRRETGNLELIVQKYNKIQTTLLPVERPLIRQHLSKIDKVINQGLKTLTWKSHGIEIFIAEATGSVEEADDILCTMKESLKSIDQLLEHWGESSIITRVTKAVTVEEFNANCKRDQLGKYQQISEGGREIHKLLKEIVKKLKISAGLPDWKSYVDFINNIVIGGLCNTVRVSLNYLCKEIDLANNEGKVPLVEVDLILSSRRVLFSPALEETSKGDGIRDEVNNWVESIYNVGSLFKRLDTPTGGTYLKEIVTEPGVMSIIANIYSNVDQTIDLAAELQKSYCEYEYLWTTDLNKMFQEFLQTAFIPPRKSKGENEEDSLVDDEFEDEYEEDNDNNRVGVSEAEGEFPDLAKFDERINHFQALRVQISELPQSKTVGFLRINTQPIKQALSTWVTKWIYLFTQYLHDHVISNLESLNQFIEQTEAGLTFDVSSGHFTDEDLKGVMRHIREVRRRMDTTERSFVPLGDAMALLKKHGISFESDLVNNIPVSEFYDVAPGLWDSTVNKAFKAREVIQPKQNAMAGRINNKAKAFALRLKDFRQEFMSKAPFGNVANVLVNPDLAYELLQVYNEKLQSEKEDAVALRELEDLFELSLSAATELEQVENDLQLLKKTWDVFSMVNFTFDSWKPILWDEIDTNKLEEEILNLQRIIDGNLPPSVHGWPVYQTLETRTKSMSVVIPLVSDLHSPALRERHWKQIMTVTGSQFDKGPRFCLENILSLRLYKYVDQVTEIVEVANKELKIDEKLRSIEDVWLNTDLVYVPHKLSNVDFKVISSPEGIIEALEEHQLQLQTLAGLGKFVDYFRERVTNWQKTLGCIETNLTLWLRVQRSWDSLETIFLSGSDIRSELPEDTKRFELLDQIFKELMVETSKTPNAMNTCCVSGRYEMLQEMWSSLEKCQKALNEYLDGKKNIFPRFYFVSNVALLDILSNGYEPLKIMPHLSACFSGIKTLVFSDTAPGGDSEKQKKKKSGGEMATAMISPEGERVDFPRPFCTNGDPVEHWLNGVTEIMQSTLQNVTNKALVKTANWDGDCPRHKWLFMFPAQVILLASQINWTDECKTAIEEADGGNEQSLEKFLELSNRRLKSLIELVQGPLSKEDRTKIITLITLDVHGKEVVDKLIQKRVESVDDFAWQSQLRFYWNDEEESCDVKITDFNSKYSFEYSGNVDRLVITPLTDRCYITLTMALRLTLGGAPAGPAGTGKTETTKDLARSLGLPCYVFNCSDQMNYQTIGDIFKGLSQTGAWGCFDEFNRIPIEVLSVVATQVKTILDAIRSLSEIENRQEPYDKVPAGKPPCVVGHFDFMGSSIRLVPTTGFFITMNPGYAGRTELPENLKAHFRSCAMIRPDLKPICQNMLMAEGFIDAEPLSVKFVTLYRLSSELLSPQPHYDWGLRNVKSVLRVAGMLKRNQPDVDETGILMRALRDFNVPKLPSFDLPIFLRLVRDLFPGINLTAKFDEDLKNRALKACKQKVDGSASSSSSKKDVSSVVVLQPEETFLNKVVNLQEIMDVRHSVMLLGSPGCGKTSIWQTLAKAHNIGESKPTCVAEVLNPKSITSNELYGFMNLQKDWKDGALSIVMRNMSSLKGSFHSYQKHHWIVLDGDIDAIWIESMNTVMDDNKVLTLVSNERISLTSKMRLVFEISTLKNATPATVSRAGILYINEDDIGWGPFVESWVSYSGLSEFEVSVLPQLFRKYMQGTMDLIVENDLQHIVPRQEIAMVQSTCRILDTLLASLSSEARLDKDVIENLYVFSMLWAVGGSLNAEKSCDNRSRFSHLWLKKFAYNNKTVVFSHAKAATGGEEDSSAQQQQRQGKEANVFDFYYNVEKKCMLPWTDKLDGSYSASATNFADICVPTANSIRVSYLLHALIENERPVCLIGSAGTGKTTLMKEYLRSISDERSNTMINMNYYTDSLALQLQLEQHIDKRSGRIYGPPGEKKLVYFIDDLNMPYVEEYGTQSPIALIRQYVDYKQWYDRQDLSVKKEIQDVQFVAAMNHKCGSFTINPRLQRHLTVIACEIPEASDLRKIYGSILVNHLDQFVQPIQVVALKVVDAAIELHEIVSSKFLPSATKFHYCFNMRDLSALFQGLLRADGSSCTTLLSFSRLFLHESTRVFADRLVNEKDNGNFRSILLGVAKKYFEEDPDEMFAPPLVFTDFIRSTQSNALSGIGVDEDVRGSSSGSGSYTCAGSYDEIQHCLEGHLAQYNSTKAKMDLVLFQLASEHVCRIARIIGTPGGNALLVGVGGSGKQSLSRLASFICGYDVVQIAVTSDYTLSDFKESLKALYRRAGLRPRSPIVLLLTDSQIIDERFLVYINDVLSSGHIPDLFAPDEYDGLFASLRAEAKANGIPNTRPHMMEFFISRVRSSLHIILCHSPVGDLFRLRSRKFPGLINCTSIDWFHPWPRDALVAVASRFLSGEEFGSDDISENVMHHIAEVHLSVTEVSTRYRETQGRYNYVTPKSFLELVAFFRQLLGSKRTELTTALERLKAGLETLRSTANDVAGLQEDLKLTMVKVEERKIATEELLEKMGQQRGEAESQQAIASKERIRAEKFAKEAKEIEEDAEIELAAAQPAMDQAEEAVNCLTKSSLTELKSLTKPPSGVDKVTTCVLMMIKNEKRNFSWDNAKRMMNNIDKFKQSLEEYDSKNIPQEVIDRVSPIVSDPDFTFEKLSKKSSAAANMASWVINILTYNEIYKKVKPLMDRLDEARCSKEEAMADLSRVEAQLDEAEQSLNALQESFMVATNEKTKVEAEAAACTDRLNLAERLVNGLSSENERWEKEIEGLQYKIDSLVGDTLLASAFVSYIGAFDSDLRCQLWSDIWSSDIISREIPLSDGVKPLSVITDDASIAQWGMEGLPADMFSIENGALITSCQRWPLIIDPQLQGINWLRMHYSGKSQKSGGNDSSIALQEDDVFVEKSNNSDGKKKGKKKKKDKEDEEGGLIVLQLSQKNWLQTLIKAIENGETVIIENVGEEIDSALDPVLSRSFYFKGKQPYVDVAGQEVEYDTDFQLFLQTRLSNPHYKPEVLAQCTLVNFIVTEGGLEDQLLARVVNLEKAELEKQKQALQRAFNEYKIQLVDLENTLLEKLSNAPDDILSDVPMIESLEATKATATDVEEAVRKGKETEKGINEAREAFRPVATEAFMLYFMLLQLGSVNHMYQFSLETFTHYFEKAMGVAEPGTPEEAVSGGKKKTPEEVDAEIVQSRVGKLVTAMRITIYKMVSRGLFVSDKMLFLIQMTFNLLKREIIELRNPDDRFDLEGLQFLLQPGMRFDLDNEIEWLPDSTWNIVCALAEQEGFEQLPIDMTESAPRFKEWFNHTTPELEKLPLDWRELDKRPFLKILVIRALRPDRCLAALSDFVAKTLPNGSDFVDCDSSLNSYQVLQDSFVDSSPSTPMYFILSPGSNVSVDIEKLASLNGMISGQTYHNISLGQGQDKVAMEMLENAYNLGWWVFLNNVHLMPSWLFELAKKLDEFVGLGKAHDSFRLFLSSDPSKAIPVSILNRCIKLTNEPPAGLKANLVRSWSSFSAEEVDNFDGKTRSILFGLCYYHTVLLERKTFMKKGFSLMYPFSGQDLSACAIVLKLYMERNASNKVPFEDLTYLFSEILYGGHVIDDFDRRVCMSYASYFFNDSLLEELEFFPFSSATGSGGGAGDDEGGNGRRAATFKVPAMPTYEKYCELINDALPGDTPLAYGLHSNAEIGFKTSQNNKLFKELLLLQSSENEEREEGSSSQHVVEACVQDILDSYRDLSLDVESLQSLTTGEEGENVSPFINTYIQEGKRLNGLLAEICRSLSELEMGFKGELSTNAAMEALMTSINCDSVPASWVRLSYPSLRPLGSWLSDLNQRINKLQDFIANPVLPNVVSLNLFFNPNSFLTAILQVKAGEGIELDKLTISTEVLKKREMDIEAPSRDGIYCSGLYLEGASWDFQHGFLEEAKPKELILPMPIINLKAVASKECISGGNNVFQCPVYRTQDRANTFVFPAQLRTKECVDKWVLANVVLLLDPSE